MPRHKPIHFKQPDFSQESQNRLTVFLEKNQVVSSMGKAVLALALVGGVLTVAAVAPGLTKMFRRKIRSPKTDKRRYRKLWERFYALKKEKIFEYIGETGDGGLLYQFTKKGETTANKFLLDTLAVTVPKRWDGQWRIVFFDIPEKFKAARHALYYKLKELGFYQLQKSVWIHPFPCEEEINFIKNVFNIHPFVEVFVSGTMPNRKVGNYFKDLLIDKL